MVVGVKRTLMTALDIRDGKFLPHSVYPSRLIEGDGSLFIRWADFAFPCFLLRRHKVVDEDLSVKEMFSNHHAK